MSHIRPDFIVDGRKLQVLQELAALGSVTAVAGALHLTPSAVSQQLAVLARSAGVPLVERHGRGVRLTPQARLLLRHADIVAAQLERARLDLESHADGLTGTVAIGALATAITGLVAPCLPALTRDRPDVRLVIHEDEDDSAFSRLVSGDLDLLLFVRGDTSGPADDNRLWQRTVHRDPLRVLVPGSHPLARRKPAVVPLAELAAEPFVAGTGGTCAQVSLAACAQAGFAPDVRHRCADWAAFGALVAAGVGIALVPTLAFAAAPPRTRLVDLADPVPVRTVAVAVRAGTEDSRLLRPVLDALEAYATRLGETTRR